MDRIIFKPERGQLARTVRAKQERKTFASIQVSSQQRCPRLFSQSLERAGEQAARAPTFANHFYRIINSETSPNCLSRDTRLNKIASNYWGNKNKRTMSKFQFVKSSTFAQILMCGLLFFLEIALFVNL